MPIERWETFLDSWPALRSRDFRLFLGGQGISLAGTFMQQVAVAWLAYTLTHSAVALGTLAFLTDAAGMLVALFGGLLADRLNPQRIVLTTQTLAMLQAFLLAGLTWSGRINFHELVLFGIVFGIINGFDVPARQVLVLQIVGPKFLGNAIVLTSLVLDSARLIGPSIGGLLVARFGEWLCFLANGVSYAAVLGALLCMTLTAPRHNTAPETMITKLTQGLRYVSRSRRIRSALLLVAVAGFAGGPYAMLMPIMATEVLGGASHTLGILMGSIGIGALAGAFFLGRRSDAKNLQHLIGIGAAIFGVSLILFASSRVLFLSVAMLVCAGFGIMILMASTHTTLLRESDEDMRGRVMSWFTLSFMAPVPIGSLFAGRLASHWNAPVVIAGGGAICIIASLLYLGQSPAPESAAN